MEPVGGPAHSVRPKKACWPVQMWLFAVLCCMWAASSAYFLYDASQSSQFNNPLHAEDTEFHGPHNPMIAPVIALCAENTQMQKDMVTCMFVSHSGADWVSCGDTFVQSSSTIKIGMWGYLSCLFVNAGSEPINFTKSHKEGIIIGTNQTLESFVMVSLLPRTTSKPHIQSLELHIKDSTFQRTLMALGHDVHLTFRQQKLKNRTSGNISTSFSFTWTNTGPTSSLDRARFGNTMIGWLSPDTMEVSTYTTYHWTYFYINAMASIGGVFAVCRAVFKFTTMFLDKRGKEKLEALFGYRSNSAVYQDRAKEPSLAMHTNPSHCNRPSNLL